MRTVVLIWCGVALIAASACGGSTPVGWLFLELLRSPADTTTDSLLDARRRELLYNTAALGSGAALVATVVGVPLGILLGRVRFRHKALLRIALSAPAFVPPYVIALIAGLETPDSGEIWLEGTRVAAERRLLMEPYERHIGFVFQDLALWPHMTVQQQLDFVLGSMSVARSNRATRILDALTLVRIEHLATRYPHELSGGEQQRAALARTLVAQPRLMLLDEPLASLDPELRTHLRNELVALQRSLGLASVYVTHDRDDATVLADRVLEMRSGRMVV